MPFHISLPRVGNGFLTTEPNAVVAPVHKKAMPVILTEPDEIDTWLSAPWEDAKHLQLPFAEERLKLVDNPAQPEPMRGSLQ